MININNHSYYQLTELLLGKRAHFTSDCEFFPNFDVIGKVILIKQNPTEILIDIIEQRGKRLTIGTNMKNLQCEIY